MEHHTWCAVCQMPTRLRIPLMQRGQQVATLEVCPGCGTGHDRAYAGVTPAQRSLPSLPWLARAVHGWLCHRKGKLSLECAYGDCHWPGLWRNALGMPGEDGDWTFVFCTHRHRSRWAREHGLGEGAVPA